MKLKNMSELLKDYISYEEKKEIIRFLIEEVMYSHFAKEKKDLLIRDILSSYYITDKKQFEAFVKSIDAVITLDPATAGVSALDLGALFVADVRNRLLKKDQNWIQIIEGQTGSGKSTASISLAIAINPDFNADYIVFTAKEYINLVKNLKKGQVVIWDETGVGFSAKDFQTNISKNISKVFQTMRFKNGATIMTAPVLGMVNLDARRLVHAIMRTDGILRAHRINYLKVYYYTTKMLKDKPIAKKIRYSINDALFIFKRLAIVRPRLKGPYSRVFKEYEKKKAEFFDQVVIKNALESMEEKAQAKEEKMRKKWEIVNSFARKVVQDPYLFGRSREPEGWVFSPSKIASHFEVSMSVAQLIKAKAEQMINKMEGRTNA